MRLTAAILIAAIAAPGAPSIAADGHDAVKSGLPTHYAAVGRDAYSLGGKGHMGAVIPDDNGPYDDDDEVKFVGDGDWLPGFGQNLFVEQNGHLISGAHTRDRQKLKVTLGDVFGAMLIGRDPADQKGTARNPNPRPNVKVVWRAAGGFKHVDRIRAKTTEQGNGRVVRVGILAADHNLEALENLRATVISGPGKAKGAGADRGDPGYGDASSWVGLAHAAASCQLAADFMASRGGPAGGQKPAPRSGAGRNHRGDGPGRNQDGEKRGRN